MERLAWNTSMEQRQGTAGKGLRRDGDEARAKSAGRAREVRGGPYGWPYSRRPDWPGRAGLAGLAGLAGRAGRPGWRALWPKLLPNLLPNLC